MRWLLLPALVLLLAACSDDPDDQQKERVTIELKPYASSYIEHEGGALTRDGDSWTPPTPYVTYDNLNAKFKDQKDLMHRSIEAFFTQDDKDPLEGTFFYRNSDETWRLSMEVNSGDYYLYGYIPKEDAENASIALLPSSTNYSDGAVLTINGLNTVTASDVCVLIGAKEGKSKSDDEKPDGERLKPGSFKTNIQATSDPDNKNDIFLLFDHLYASLLFRFFVNDVYAELRTIRLKKLELIPYSDNSQGKVYAKFNATITLRANDAGTSPIVGNVVFTPDENSVSVPNVPIFEGDVKLMTGEKTDFMGCFVPGDNTYFKLRSTYDVYDKNPGVDSNGDPVEGNLIRRDCQAENTIDLRKWFGNDLTRTRGQCYSLILEVMPTYLYVLSDPDLNNPTVKISN